MSHTIVIALTTSSFHLSGLISHLVIVPDIVVCHIFIWFIHSSEISVAFTIYEKAWDIIFKVLQNK